MIINNSYFQNLCIKEFTNNISDGEIKILKDLLKSSNEKQKEYNELKNVWVSTHPIGNKIEIDLNKEWKNFESKLIEEVERKSAKPMIKMLDSFSNNRFKPAFALSAIIALIISTLILFNDTDSEQVLKTITTSNGQRTEVRLSDGSNVILNNASEIQFYENFEEDKREVILKGEAFFSINKDGRSFIIKTDNAKTMVLGTEFNVWSRNNKTKVIVKEGSVGLSKVGTPNQKVILNKGEVSAVIKSKSPLPPTKINPEHALGWLDGKIVFSDTPLDEVILELQRYYDKQVILDNSELVKYNLTGSFNNEPINRVLAKICLALNLSYTENNNGYTIIE